MLKPVDIKLSTHVDIEVDDHVRKLKYKNIFAKRSTPNKSKEVSVIIKIKNTVPSTYAIEDLSAEEIVWTFYERETQKQIRVKGAKW